MNLDIKTPTFKDTFTYGILAADMDGNVLHAVVYPVEPNYKEYLSLIVELMEDEELGMTDLRFGVDYTLVPAPDVILKQMCDEVMNGKFETRVDGEHTDTQA